MMYLDANARYLPKGTKFFVAGSIPNGILFDAGLRTGQPALCKMLDGLADNPRISVKVNGKIYIIRGCDWDVDDCTLTYEGTPCGCDFICSASEAACESLIGGFDKLYWGVGDE